MRARSSRPISEVKCIRDKDDFLIPFIETSNRSRVQDRD
jgi:hypothetical protein